MMSQLRRVMARATARPAAAALASRRMGSAAAVALRRVATPQQPQRSLASLAAAAASAANTRVIVLPVAVRAGGNAQSQHAVALRRAFSAFVSAPNGAPKPDAPKNESDDTASAPRSSGKADDEKVDPLAEPNYALSADQVHTMQRSFGQNAAQRLGVGVGLSVITSGALWAGGLMGAHPILIALMNIVPTMAWSMSYSMLIGMSQIITRTIVDYGTLRLVLQPLLQAIPSRATDSVDHFLIALHREAKAMRASPTPGMQGFMETHITKYLDMVMKQLPSRIQQALDERDAALHANPPSPVVAGAGGASSAGAGGHVSPAAVEPSVFHDVVLRVTEQLMLEQIAVYQRRTHVLLWGAYSCYVLLLAYGLWFLKTRRERKAKEKAEREAKGELNTKDKAVAAAKAAGTAVSGAAHAATDKARDLAAATKGKLTGSAGGSKSATASAADAPRAAPAAAAATAPSVTAIQDVPSAPK